MKTEVLPRKARRMRSWGEGCSARRTREMEFRNPHPKTLYRPSASARVIKGADYVGVFLRCETDLCEGRSHTTCPAGRMPRLHGKRDAHRYMAWGPSRSAFAEASAFAGLWRDESAGQATRPVKVKLRSTKVVKVILRCFYGASAFAEATARRDGDTRLSPGIGRYRKVSQGNGRLFFYELAGGWYWGGVVGWIRALAQRYALRAASPRYSRLPVGATTEALAPSPRLPPSPRLWRPGAVEEGSNAQCLMFMWSCSGALVVLALLRLVRHIAALHQAVQVVPAAWGCQKHMFRVPRSEFGDGK
jgi:hypothetical protein